MATGTGISRLNQTLHSPQLTKPLIRFFVVGVTAMVVILAFVSAIQAVQGQPKAASDRALTAMSARYQGLAERSLLVSTALSQKSLEAASARYQEWASHDALKNSPISQRALAAMSARFQALADAYNAGK